MQNNPFSDFLILGQDEAVQEVNHTRPDYWNVISLWSGGGGRHGYELPIFTGALDICQRRFHDIVRKENEDNILCSEEDIIGVLKFSRLKRGKPLLVHCFAGISRSAAIATLVLLDAFRDISKFPVDDALNIVYKTRSCARPNRLILHLGLPIVANDLNVSKIRTFKNEVLWFRELYNNHHFLKSYTELESIIC